MQYKITVFMRLLWHNSCDYNKFSYLCPVRGFMAAQRLLIEGINLIFYYGNKSSYE